VCAKNLVTEKERGFEGKNYVLSIKKKSLAPTRQGPTGLQRKNKVHKE
jgi:hypothetical protein